MAKIPVLFSIIILAVAVRSLDVNFAGFKPFQKSRINSLPEVTDTPIFGVLSLSSSEIADGEPFQYIQTSYVKFLEMSGARVVPILSNGTYEEIDKLLGMVNGVLFTGGTYPFWLENTPEPVLTPDYAAKGCYIYEKVKQFNDLGHFFPLWGTCLGSELLHVCANNQYETISNFVGEPAYTQLHRFTNYSIISNIFNYPSYQVGQKIKKIYESEYVSLLGHHFGISPDSYKKYSELNETFEIVSTLKDLKGSEFVGIVEAKKYPIFGVQFHPEINIYEFTKPVYPHFNNAISASSFLSKFIVSLARKNTNTFPESELNKYLIYQWPVIRIPESFKVYKLDG